MAGRSGDRVRDVTLQIAQGITSRSAARRAAGSPRCCTCLAASKRRRPARCFSTASDVTQAVGSPAQPAAAAADRLRLPAILPAADAHRRREHRAAAVGSRRRRRPNGGSARGSCSNTWASPRAPIIGRRSCPAARCSAWRLRARWPTDRGLLLADEPTGELDRSNRRTDRRAARSRQCGRHGAGHRHARSRAGRTRTRVLTMRDGRIESESASR